MNIKSSFYLGENIFQYVFIFDRRNIFTIIKGFYLHYCNTLFFEQLAIVQQKTLSFCLVSDDF